MIDRGSALSILLLAACGAAPRQEPTTIEAYYQGQLFSASYRELEGGTVTSDAAVLYESEQPLVGGAPFVRVLDGTASPVWHEIAVSGVGCAGACAPPRQLRSAEEILAAQAAGEVRLIETGTRCSVLGLEPVNRKTTVSP